MKPIFTLAAILAIAACENPVEHFSEGPEKPREIHIGPDCLGRRDSTTVDSLGREQVNWSCEVGR